MKRVFSLTLIKTLLQYTPSKAKGLAYIFLSIAFLMHGFAQYIFFTSTLYRFGDDISPRSQLYWEQR